MRVGLGQDSHKIKLKTKNSKLKTSRLGGIELKNWEIVANSDGDVILHALCNALSSAIGGDSLGTWADEMCLQQDITNSQEFVKEIMKKVKNKGYRINNVSISIEAKKPRLSLTAFQKMKTKISQLLEIQKSAIGITITSGEEITPFGQGKAIQVLALVSLIKNED